MSSYDDFIKSICRICLVFYKSEKMVSLIDTNDKDGLSLYAKAVLSFANIVIDKQDDMPTSMCLNCLCLLKQAINFKLKCESSDKSLKNIASNARNSTILKEKIVQYTMFNLYLPEEPIDDTSKRQWFDVPITNLKREGKKLKVTDIHTNSHIGQTNSCGKISAHDAKVDGFLNKLDLQFTSKKKNLKVTKQIKKRISTDNFDDNLNIPIEFTNDMSNKEYSTSGIKSEIQKNSFDEPPTDEKFNLSAVQFASTSKDIMNGEEMDKSTDIKHDGNHLVKIEIVSDDKSITVKPDSLDTSTHDPDDNNIPVDCSLDKLDNQIASTSKKIMINKQLQNIKQKDDSNSSSADHILDQLQNKFASKYSFSQLEPVKPLKRKKLRICKRYREKRKKMLEKKRKMENNIEQVCGVCDKVLANKHTYEQHMQRHEGCRYICEHCGKGFPVLYELQTHQVTQHGTGPHLKCSQCPFKTARKFDLMEHERIHSGERPYTCDKCGLTFRRRGIWRKHLIYHDEKTVQCPHCPKKFFQRSEMLAHANNIHDRVYVYLCNKCGATYAKAATVRRHMADRHGIAKELQGKVVRIKKGSSNEQ